MKKLLFVCVTILAMGSLMAGPVSQQTAQRIGEKFLSATTLGQERTSISLQLVSTAASRGEVDYYVFNVRDGEGFVIVAGDNRVKPILAYATSGAFNPADVADGFEFTLSSFRTEIQYVREHNLTATPDIVTEWETVSKTGNLQHGRQVRSVVGPLCQTIWNQNYPYNSQCPEDPEGSGGYVYAGCVATAMAQVMKFHDWPNQGVGSYSYNPSGYPQQTANFGETEYHFELMPLAVDSTSTEEEIFYIAQFQHHCGIAVDMQYSGSGSGAYSDDVPPALRQHFRYDCDNHETNSNYWGWGGYTNEEWTAMLKAGGLDEGLPLYYSGQDDSWQGGHAFVCDGYDENDYFHFNWGWSGRDDAWCPIGALNTTKYAFNMMNGFTGHIVPQAGEYYQRADSVADMQLMENGSFNGVVVSWTNPSLKLNGESLTDIESVTVRRNAEVIATLTNAQPGATMSFEDSNLAPGLYEYAIYVTNASGISRNTYRSILVGEKCDVVFQLHDTGGDGWKGASISVTDENGSRIAVVTMTEGYEQTVTLPLLKQNLNFIWNHGWYHTQSQYDTDFECSFSILDYENNEIFVSDDLEDCVFLTYMNACEFVPLTCYPVRNLQGEYQWHNNEEYGAYLTWEAPENTANLHHFQILRSVGAYKDDELVAEILFNGNANYDYFDNTYSISQEDTYYSVNSVYIRGSEQCESEYMDVMVGITDVEENAADIHLYPNPTKDLLYVEGQGTMTVSVYNMLGQEVSRMVAEGQTVVDLGSNGSGVYMIRIETANQVVIRKITVNK